MDAGSIPQLLNYAAIIKLLLSKNQRKDLTLLLSKDFCRFVSLWIIMRASWEYSNLHFRVPVDAQQLNINLAFSHYQRDIIMMNGTPHGETSGWKNQRQPVLASSVKAILWLMSRKQVWRRKTKTCFGLAEPHWSHLRWQPESDKLVSTHTKRLLPISDATNTCWALENEHKLHSSSKKYGDKLQQQWEIPELSQTYRTLTGSRIHHPPH